MPILQKIMAYEVRFVRTTARCKRKGKQEVQRRWLEENPGYFGGRYDYVKEWRRKRAQGEGEDPLETSYALFNLLRGASKHTLLSAVREANKLGTFKVANNLLHPSESKHHPVFPQDNKLLNITYERSDLAKYDDLI